MYLLPGNFIDSLHLVLAICAGLPDARATLGNYLRVKGSLRTYYKSTACLMSQITLKHPA